MQDCKVLSFAHNKTFSLLLLRVLRLAEIVTMSVIGRRVKKLQVSSVEYLVSSVHASGCANLHKTIILHTKDVNGSQYKS